jgi:hypothetical protein
MIIELLTLAEYPCSVSNILMSHITSKAYIALTTSIVTIRLIGSIVFNSKKYVKKLSTLSKARSNVKGM